LDEFARGAQQADDITLLILRYQTPTLQRAIPQPEGA